MSQYRTVVVPAEFESQYGRDRHGYTEETAGALLPVDPVPPNGERVWRLVSLQVVELRSGTFWVFTWKDIEW